MNRKFPGARLAWWFVFLVGCSRAANGDGTTGGAKEGDREHRDEAEHAALPRRIHLSREVIGAAKIASAPATSEVLEPVADLVGELVSDPDRTARVTAPVAGRIERVSFVEGETVAARALLATVRVADLADRHAAHASAEARAVAASQNLAQRERLVAEGLAPSQELVDARALAAATKAEAGAAGERLRAIDARPGSIIELRAPIAGTVVTRDAVVGQPADPEKPIATIADLSEVWFIGRLFETDLARIHPDAEAEVELNAYPKQRFDGKVTLIGRQIDPVARTVTARIPLANRGDLLRLGLFGTARVAAGDTRSREPVLTVARSALSEINGKPFVFVQHPDDDFELHPVVVGRTALGKVEIQSGLREGERVVVEGVFTLKSLVLKSTLAEED